MSSADMSARDEAWEDAIVTTARAHVDPSIGDADQAAHVLGLPSRPPAYALEFSNIAWRANVLSAAQTANHQRGSSL